MKPTKVMFFLHASPIPSCFHGARHLRVQSISAIYRHTQLARYICTGVFNHVVLDWDDILFGSMPNSTHKCRYFRSDVSFVICVWLALIFFFSIAHFFIFFMHKKTLSKVRNLMCWNRWAFRKKKHEKDNFPYWIIWRVSLKNEWFKKRASSCFKLGEMTPNAKVSWHWDFWWLRKTYTNTGRYLGYFQHWTIW